MSVKDYNETLIKESNELVVFDFVLKVRLMNQYQKGKQSKCPFIIFSWSLFFNTGIINQKKTWNATQFTVYIRCNSIKDMITIIISNDSSRKL